MAGLYTAVVSQLQSAFFCVAAVHPSGLPWSWLGTAGHDIGKCGIQVLQIQPLVLRGGPCFNRWTNLHQEQSGAHLAVYPCCFSCVVTQSWVPPRHVFLLQSSKKSNCKSYCMSLWLYQRLGEVVPCRFLVVGKAWAIRYCSCTAVIPGEQLWPSRTYTKIRLFHCVGPYFSLTALHLWLWDPFTSVRELSHLKLRVFSWCPHILWWGIWNSDFLSADEGI